MKSDLFAELMGAANDVLEHAKGKRDLRTTKLPRLPDPMEAEEVRHVRERLHASQAVLARYLNVSTKLVQAWESEERTPAGPALVLLRLLEKQPAILDMFESPGELGRTHVRKTGHTRKLAAR
jgi:putative transcriptional regulator